MDIKEFGYQFDKDLIAKHPLNKRDESKLLVVDVKNLNVEHKRFYELVDYIEPGDVIVINNSYVKKARIFGKRNTGGKVEIFIVDFPYTPDFNIYPLKLRSLIRSHKKIKENEKIIISPFGDNDKEIRNEDKYAGIKIKNQKTCMITAKKHYGGGIWDILINSKEDCDYIFNHCAGIPLPPYIKRQTNKNDEIFYQTIYANKNAGYSVAAPTAGLHFTDTLIKNIKKKGAVFAKITLNIGLGTFMPVRKRDITKHVMHDERYTITEQTAQIINEAKKNNKKVIITGTSSVRCLESSTDKGGTVMPVTDGVTSLYIYPGYKFKITGNLITNFHQPESSLFIMISALVGLNTAKKIYKKGLDNKYSLFSYGDAMFLYNI